MKKNVGKKDATIRYVIGIIFVVLAVLYSLWFLIPAAVAFATGYFGVCGLYKVFGINTCKVKS